ncbi:dehydrogenase/reductase SDR family member 4 [Contarinia nasturtii]|uniref:dehydrogenase/reductase SDR family member 4 n=1 Tax=Contarinia nasturtii TaxID=265458 RepID=UPI0012D3C986|nr:dehydrogenase/reductase SDR family member 4 [Contarinia nasturtii]
MAHRNISRLVNKVAVITASTDGIGFAIAKRFAAEGAKVVVSSRKPENVSNAVNKLKNDGFSNVIGVKCHVSDANDRKNLFDETLKNFGKIDILVSNAAVNPVVGPVLACPEDAWDKIFDVNVKASFLLAKEVTPILRDETNGSIIFVSSYAGLNPFPLIGAYSVSKTALIGLTKALAQNLAPENIRVNCVAPGIIRTKFGSVMYESETAHEAALSMIPMNRLGEVEDISGLVAFLASDDAAYITGETIVAAGGMPSRL